MLELGKIQSLEMVNEAAPGVYLAVPGTIDGQKVLLPKRQVPEGLKKGDLIDVFLYKDSEDRLIATTTFPLLTLGETALLKVAEATPIGAFLDWGLAKDLLLPFKEQTSQVKAGDMVVAALYIDKSSRLCSTMKVYDYLSTDSPYHKDDKITGTVYEFSEDFGAYVAVDNKYSGMIPIREIFSPVRPGDVIEARVAAVKPDGKLDLSLRQKTFVQMGQDADIIHRQLENAGGFLPYHDKSDAEDIKREFKLSKNAFKRAIGHLLKDGRIEITSSGIKIKER